MKNWIKALMILLLKSLFTLMLVAISIIAGLYIFMFLSVMVGAV